MGSGVGGAGTAPGGQPPPACSLSRASSSFSLRVPGFHAQPRHPPAAPTVSLGLGLGPAELYGPKVLSTSPTLRSLVTPVSSSSSNAPPSPNLPLPRHPIPAGDGELMPGGQPGRGGPGTERDAAFGASGLWAGHARFLMQTAARGAGPETRDGHKRSGWVGAIPPLESRPARLPGRASSGEIGTCLKRTGQPLNTERGPYIHSVWFHPRHNIFLSGGGGGISIFIFTDKETTPQRCKVSSRHCATGTNTTSYVNCKGTIFFLN